MTLDDPAMPLLHTAMDAAVMAPRLAQLLGLAPDGVRLLPPCLMRHKRGRRSLIEYAVQGGPVLLGKMRAKGLDQRAHDIQHALWRAGLNEASRDGIAVPEPLGCLPELDMWVQRRVAGETVGTLLGTEAGQAAILRAAEALSRLHKAEVPAQRSWRLMDEMAMLHRRLNETITRHPDLSVPIQAIADTADGLARLLPTHASTAIHRDFYPDQLLFEGATHRMWILDLDLHAEGDPALDAGNFIAHLVEAALRLRGDAEAFQPLEDAFRDRFLNLSPHLDAAVIDGWAALSLTRHIAISSQIAGREHLTRPLLALSRNRLASALRGLSRFSHSFQAHQLPA